MPRYNLPDGRYVDVPADADRDYYIRLQNTLAQEYPDNFTQYKEPTETTLGGNVLMRQMFECGLNFTFGVSHK